MHHATKRRLCRVVISHRPESPHLLNLIILSVAFPFSGLYCREQLHSYTISIFWKDFIPADSSIPCGPRGYRRWAARKAKRTGVKTTERKLINASYYFVVGPVM